MENKVNVTRYLRPHNCSPWDRNDRPYLDFDNLYGITFLFEIDYSKGIVTSSWDICNGDNFNKKSGKYVAKTNGQEFEFELRLVEECEGLINGLIAALFSKYRKEIKYLPINFECHLLFFNKANRLIKGI